MCVCVCVCVRERRSNSAKNGLQLTFECTHSAHLSSVRFLDGVAISLFAVVEDSHVLLKGFQHLGCLLTDQLNAETARRLDVGHVYGAHTDIP